MPSEAGWLLVVAVPVVLAGSLLLVRCLCQRQASRDVREAESDGTELTAGAEEKGEGLQGGPPAHWGGGLSFPAKPVAKAKAEPSAAPRASGGSSCLAPRVKSERRSTAKVTFRTQDSVMEFPTLSSSTLESLQVAPIPEDESTAPSKEVEPLSAPKAIETGASTPAVAPAPKGSGKGPAKGAKGTAEGSPEASSTAEAKPADASPAAAPAPKGSGKGPAKGAKGTEGSPEASSTAEAKPADASPAAAPGPKGGGKGPAKGAKGTAEGSPEASSTAETKPADASPASAPGPKGGGKGPAKGAKGPKGPAAKGPAPAACDPNRGETITGKDLEEEVTLWVEAISGESKGDETFGKWLKDGRVLCGVANQIQPGIIPNINSSKMPFKQMENVTAFIQACRKLGVLEKDVFSTVDLFEAKNLASVQRCIFNLGSAVRRTAPDFQGPFLGVAQNAKVGDSKRQSQAVTQFTGLRQDIADELRTGHNVRVAGQQP